ncbi:M48 family metallopeptidase [Streptomyces sp. NPDC005900]|uniref:M48 family metallopeptidase n=1 Tax=Streptomyces sp. NPDC005900 TaxID=3154569 RepID=UPI0034069DDA
MRPLSTAARRQAKGITLQVIAGALVIGGMALTSAFAAAWLAVMVSSLTVFLLLPGMTAFVSAAVFPLMVLDIRVLRQVLRTGGLPRDATWVPPTAHATLHAAVREAAEAMGTPPPDRVWLTSRPTASVHQVRRFLRRPRRIRQICIGLPLLAGVSEQELGAVLCHELAHYTQRHATFSTSVYRGSILLDATRMRLSREQLPTSDVPAVDQLLKAAAWLQRQIVAGYSWVYDVMTLFVRRRHEYAADRTASQIWTAETVAAALCRADTIAAAWARFATQFARAQHEGALPTGDLFHLFTLTLDYPQPSPPQTRAPWHRALRDSHPPLHRRLKALAPSVSSGPTPTQRNSALGLLDPDPELLTQVAALTHFAGPRQSPTPENETEPIRRWPLLGPLTDAVFITAGSIGFLAFWLSGHFSPSPDGLPLRLAFVVAPSLCSLGLVLAVLAPAAGPRRLRRWINVLNFISVAVLLCIGSLRFGTAFFLGDVSTSMMSLALLVNTFVFSWPLDDPGRQVGATRTILSIFFAGGFAFNAPKTRTDEAGLTVPLIPWSNSVILGFLLYLLPSVVVLVWPQVRKRLRRLDAARELRLDAPAQSAHK